MRTLLVSLLALPLALPLSAQKDVHDLTMLNARNSAIGGYPDMVANMGDLDGDGHDDLALGVYNSTFNPSGDGSVVLLSGATGRELDVIHGGELRGQFGRQVANVGDVDKDGVPDLCVGAPASPAIGTSTGPGMVFVYSGKTRKLLLTIKNPTGAARGFGLAIDAIGDVDKDGYADFVVGAPDENNKGAAYIISGKTGSVHVRIAPSISIQKFGQALVGLPDVDSDQVPDVAILCRFANVNSSNVYGAIFVHSGKHGGLIHTISPSPTYVAEPNILLRTCPDIDGDKNADLAVGFPNGSTAGRYHGEVHLYSSGTGKMLTLLKAPGWTTGSSFGNGFDAIPDVDQDGSPELLVCDPKYVSGNSSAGGYHLFSAKSGKLLRTFTSTHTMKAGVRLGASVDFLGDLNRDGNWDFMSEYYDPSVANRRAIVLSANPIDLSSDVKSLSLFRGGKSAISIHAGTRHANALAMMLGSASGTWPGIQVGQGTLQLNLDAYLQFTLAAPHAVFFNNMSLLDARGEGGVGFVLPAGLPPSLAGTRLYHSCLMFGTHGLDFANISIPLDLTLF